VNNILSPCRYLIANMRIQLQAHFRQGNFSRKPEPLTFRGGISMVTGEQEVPGSDHETEDAEPPGRPRHPRFSDEARFQLRKVFAI
jgi:hypothetical protein